MADDKILIVEDDTDIRELTTLYLEKKGFQVLSAGNGNDALRIVKNDSPQLILLDVLLPGMNGYDICRKIREITESPVLFISCKREAVDKVRGLNAGADDYITKPFDLLELEARVKANLRRNRIQSSQLDTNRKIFRHEHFMIDLNSYEVYVNGKIVPLYKKELQLLVLLVENQNQVFSVEQLYDHIWGVDSFGDMKTVMVHISNLRRKIEKDPAKPVLIHTVRGFGYKFSKPKAVK
nr:response regulator transcription factor [Evansella caseinilytica]